MKFIHEPVQTRHFDATNLDDLLMFRKAFEFENLNVKKVQENLKAEFDKTMDKTPDNLLKIQTDFTFGILPKQYVASRALGWKANLLFKVDNVGEYTVIIDGSTAKIEKGAVGASTCVINTDVTSLACQLALIRIEDTMEDDELSDADLEMVAGGKGGGCGAEASGASACGQDYAGVGACGAAACGGAACGGAACGAAACGGDACGGAACGGAACGGAACGGAACGGDACGAAACGADACLGAACGAAMGNGVCAGNACGVDIQGAADIGPCAINVCPGIPGI